VIGRVRAQHVAAGDPVPFGMSGVEIESRSARVAGNVLHVKVKATP
jgi:hypothetical protein